MGNKKTTILSLVLIVLIAISGYLIYDKYYNKPETATSNQAQTEGVPFAQDGFEKPDLNPVTPTDVPSDQAAQEEQIPTLFLPQNASEGSIAMTICNVSRMAENVSSEKNKEEMRKFILDDLAKRVENPSDPSLQKVQEKTISSNGNFDEIVSVCNG